MLTTFLSQITNEADVPLKNAILKKIVQPPTFHTNFYQENKRVPLSPTVAMKLPEGKVSILFYYTECKRQKPCCYLLWVSMEY